MSAMYGSLRGGSEETHGNFTVSTGIRPADLFSRNHPGGWHLERLYWQCRSAAGIDSPNMWEALAAPKLLWF